MSKQNFLTVFLAVFLALVAFSAYRDYAQSHTLIVFRRVGDDYFQADSIATPFHQDRGYLSMIPLHREKSEDGHWNQKYGEDSEVDRGTTLLGSIRGDENSRLQYIIVCSSEELKTSEDVREAAWDPRYDTSSYFDPYDYLPRYVVLECP